MTSGIGAGFGGGGSSGARFVVNFSVEGTGKSDLKEIEQGFEGISMKSLALNEALEKVGEAGMGLVEVGVSIVEGWGHAFETLLHKGGEFEQMLLRIQATGKTGEQARQMMNDAIEFTQKLPITESDAVRIMTTLATAHIDALKPMGETYEQLAKKQKTLKDLPDILGIDRMKKEGPNAVSIVGDLLASMGHLGSAYQGMAIHETMQFIETGMARSPMTFGPMIVEVRKLGHTAHTAEARLKGLQEILEKRGALGISVAAMSTLGGVMSNFKGLLDKVTVAIMEPSKPGGAMSMFVAGLMRLYESISMFFDAKTPEGAKFLSMMKDLAQTVSGALVKGMEMLGSAIKVVFGFMSDHPALVKTIALLSVVAAGVMILAGAFLVVTAAIGAAIISFSLVGETLGVAAGIVSGAAIIFAGLSAAAFVVYEAIEHNFGGILDFFQDFKLVVDAMGEAFDNWGNGVATISEETAQKLEHRGLMGVFLSVGNMIRQAQVFWEQFSDTVQARWAAVSGQFEEAWEKFSGAFGRITQAIRNVTESFAEMSGSGQDAIDDASNSGAAWGNTIGTVLYYIADVVSFLANIINDNMPSVGTLTTIGNTASFAFQSLKLMADVALIPIKTIFDTMKGIAQVGGAVMKGDYAGAKTAFEAIGERAGSRAADVANQAGKVYDAAGRLVSDEVEGPQSERYGVNGMGRRGAPTMGPPDPTAYDPTYHPSMSEAGPGLDPGRFNSGQHWVTPREPRQTVQVQSHIYLDKSKIGEAMQEYVTDTLEKQGYHPSGH